MRLSNPPKAMIVLVALICITILMLAGRITSEAGVGLMGLIVGYGIGNGIAAKQGDPVTPIFDTTKQDRRSTDERSTE